MVRLSPVGFGSLRSCAIAACLVLALPARAAAPDPGQIFKCTDGSGNVTYQNEPCPKSMKAGKVEIFDNSWTSDRVEKEADWRRKAIEHRVVTGMPLPFVREALGEPAEVRATATAGAAEVWVYSFPDRSVQVGVLNNQVLWFREAPLAAPAPAARATPGADRPPLQSPPEPQVARAPAVDQSARDLPVTRLTPSASDAAPRPVSPAPAEPSRPDAEAAPAAPTSAGVISPARTVVRGQDCKQAIAALGPPDRQRDVPALDAGTDPTTEYFYEASAGSGATRTRVVCANGKVEGVDRSVIR
jgi:uncharacterized protein DUF4124